MEIRFIVKTVNNDSIIVGKFRAGNLIDQAIKKIQLDDNVLNIDKLYDIKDILDLIKESAITKIEINENLKLAALALGNDICELQLKEKILREELDVVKCSDWFIDGLVEIVRNNNDVKLFIEYDD